jgi:small-conductance mechanosensitive channel
MTRDESKKLQVGDRVHFNGDSTDSGKVTAIEARYVTIEWRDGHRSYTGHREMQRVELVGPSKVKRK